jgi:uroporphyrin-III C-methyltransferase / precorrin-2 dehydrogenase / sirohydrochlorin ferrochelatase
VSVHLTTGEIQPSRIRPLARLPIFLALEGKRALVAGGGAAAAWKVELLSAAGARVEVFAEQVSEELYAVSAAPPSGAMILHRRDWTADDFAGAAIAVGAFEHDADAAAFAQVARAAGVPVNVIDKPAFCDFAFGAIVNRSPLVIGISTDGAAPVFAQAIRAKIETLLPQGFAAWAAAAQRWRSRLRAAGLSHQARGAFWHLFAKRAIIEARREPAHVDFDRLIAEATREGRSGENGAVTEIDVSASDPDLLTLRAVRAMQSADVIFYDDGVTHDVLDFARREARKITVAANDDHPALMKNLAKQGRRVVRLRCVPASAATHIDDQTKSRKRAP